jgi:hypothetical protein
VSPSNDLRERITSNKESQVILVNGRMRQNEFWRWTKLPCHHRLRVLGHSRQKTLSEKPRRPLNPYPSLSSSDASMLSVYG